MTGTTTHARVHGRLRRALNSLPPLGALCLCLSLAVPAAPADPPAGGDEARGAAGSGTRPAPAARAGAAAGPSEYANGPSSPAGAVQDYIDASRRGDYTTAARFLVLDSIPEESRELEGPEYARQLKIVLDRKLWIQYEALSNDPEGNLDDDLPDNLERIGAIGNVEILLKRVAAESGEPGEQVWKFASGTVAAVPALYEEFGYGKLGELLPPEMFEFSFAEIQLWQWIGIVLLVLLAYLLAWIVASIVYRIVRTVVARTETKLDDRFLERVIAPLRFLVFVLFFALGALALRLSVPAYEFLRGLEKGLAVLGFTWILLRCVDVFSEVFNERLSEAGNRAAMAVVPLGRRVVKVVLLGLAVIAMLQNLGFNVTGVLAGLGVGGLAVALAAQKSIANVFGGVSLIVDQPVRVGDFCRYGDGKVGTVEDVGLRSTRIRTLDRSLVTVPNSDFSEIQLENLTVRDKIRLHGVIGLLYETSPDQLRYVLAELRKLLIAHPKVADQPARVRFTGFGAYSLDLEVFAYILTQDFNEFLKIREDIYLRFMDIVESSGTGFAFPSQTLYLGRDGGLDGERTREAESRVQAWRAGGELPFPDFSEDVVARLDNTADYPPRGSAVKVQEPADG